MAEYVCLGLTSTIVAYSLEDWSALSPFASYDAAAHGICVNSDSTLLAVAGNSTTKGKIAVYNTSDWSEVTIANKPPFLAKDVHFSPNDDYLAILSKNNADATMRFRVYRTSDWSWHKSNYPFPHNSAEKVRWSHSGAYIAIVYTGASPYLRIIKVSDWSTVSFSVTLPGYALCLDWSHNDNYLAIGHVNSPYVTIIDTSDWSDSGIDLTSELPTSITTVQGLAWNADSTYLAIGHNGAQYVTVIDTSDWTAISTTAPAGYQDSVDWNSDESILVCSGAASACYMAALDTSDWSLKTGLPTSSYAYDQCIFNPPVYNQLYSKVAFPPDIDWGYSPSAFEGIAVIEGGQYYANGCFDGEQVKIYRYIGGKYYYYETLQPQGTECQVMKFAPGNVALWHGGETPNYIGWSTRNSSCRWGEFSEDAWGGTIQGSQPTSISFSKDGLYRIGTYHDIYEHHPRFEYWDGDSWERYTYSLQEQIDGWDEFEELAHQHKVAISPDGKYIAQSCASVTYPNEPYFFIWENHGTKYHTKMDINFGGYTFTNTNGFYLTWSPDGKTIVAFSKAFQYNDTNEEWEIVADSLWHTYHYRNSFSPVGFWLACHTSGTVNLYSVSGSTIIWDQSITGFSGTVTCVHFTENGLYLFVGTAPATGNCVFMYDIDGSTFTLNTDTDWSDVSEDIVQIDSNDPPLEVDGGVFSSESEILTSAFYEGLLHNAGDSLQEEYNVYGESSLYRGLPYAVEPQFKANVSFQVEISSGKFSVSPVLFAEKVPVVTSGPFIHLHSITGALPLWVQILSAISIERANNSPPLDPYIKNDQLFEASERHSLDMATNLFLSHTGSDGSTFSSRLGDANYIMTESAEIVSQGHKSFTGQDFVDLWMDNPTTEGYILHATMDEIGIGVDLGSNDENYICIAFARWNPHYQAHICGHFITTCNILEPASFLGQSKTEYLNSAKTLPVSFAATRYEIWFGNYLIPNLISFNCHASEKLYVSITATFKYSQKVFEEIESRSDELFFIAPIYLYGNVQWTGSLVSTSVPLNEFSYSGGINPTMTIKGTAYVGWAYIVYDNELFFRSLTKKEITKRPDSEVDYEYHFGQPDWYIKPRGQIINGDDTFWTGEIDISVTPNNESMVLKESQTKGEYADFLRGFFVNRTYGESVGE